MAAEPYHLRMEDRPGYLYVSVTGERDSYETTIGAVREIAGLCRERGTAKLLVEHEIPGRLSTLEIFKIASELPSLYEGIHVGFVIRGAQIPDNPEFLQNVARNRGAQGRLFGDAVEAETWLLSL